MLNAKKIPMLLSRRQKRLLFWRQQFANVNLSSATPSKGDLSSEEREKVSALLETYKSLISKMAKTENNEQQLEECEQRLQALERDLEALFEYRRMLTSDIGKSISDQPIT